MQRTTTWVARAVGAVTPADERVITGTVETDSRECGPGSLYVARRGENADGHDYAKAAVRAGAVAVICERPLDLDVPQIVVSDSTEALGVLAKAHLADLRASGPITVLGITGSVGKTTTKDLMGPLFSSVAPSVWPAASFNNEVGCPLTVLRAGTDTRYLILEMGSSGPGHLSYLTDIAPLDVAVELLVGTAHLGGFGTVEVLAKAKEELVDGLLPDGIAILNLDDEQVAAMARDRRVPPVRFSAAGNPSADVRAENTLIDDFGRASFDLVHPGGRVPVSLQLAGEHQVSNALAAASAALAAGLDAQTIADVLSAAGPGSPHRMDVRTGVAWKGSSDLTVIDDAYNANPDSLRSGLAAARQISGNGRLVAVIGEMLELGEASDDLHSQVGRYVNAAEPALVVGVGAGVRPLLEQVDGPTIYATDSSSATQALIGELESGDTVFLKGSYGSGVWQVADSISAE